MSVSPKVDFTFENNNVVQTAPSLGVSFVYAATSKGPVNDASEIINSVANFRRVFGEELNGGPISQIERALKGGSKLRICRVAGAGSTPGSISGGKITFASIAELGFRLKYPYDNLGESPKLEFKNVNGKVNLVLSNATGVLENIYLYSTQSVTRSVAAASETPVAATEEEGKTSTKTTSSTSTKSSVAPLAAGDTTFNWDIEGLLKFNNLSNYLQVFVASDLTANGNITDVTKLYDYLQTKTTFTVSNTTATVTNGTYKAPSKATDYTAEAVMDVLRDYMDVYQVAFSGINTLLKSQAEIRTVHKAWADIFVPLQEYTLYVEVPSVKGYGTEQDITLTNIIAWVTDHIGTLGNSKYIAYFAGGNKIYDSQGIIRDTDAMGTILGLGDSSASNYGPWRSFAGMNRGIMWDVVGPVLPNYGAPSRYDQLNELAQAYVNMVVIKDTPNYGKQTLLWHLFTSQFKQDSERFLSIVRLNLYLKKTLRPILEKYIEEPNHWVTWKNIFVEVKPILDALIDAEAMSQYEWLGDQNANSYKDLTINNEADVRQGKYRAQLKYKDIVPMQEITINIVIDTAEQTVSITND